MLYIAHILNFTLMIALPLALGIWMTRQLKLSWGLFGWGALTFIAAQVLHIPFNQFMLVPWIVRLGFPGSVIGLVLGSLLVGLSAGLFEELARYIVLSRWACTARTWRTGLLCGAGHGGAEAIVLGGFALVAFIQAVALREADLVAVLGADQVGIARQQLDAYWALSPWVALLGAIERVFALLIQMSAALMVVIAIVRREWRWLVAAILWHAFVDAVAVYIMQSYGVYLAEASVFVMALIALGFIYWVRRSGVMPAVSIEGEGALELRSGSSRPRNRGDLERISEDLDQSRYV